MHIVVYTEEFLSPSMTFIARQIETLRSRHEVTVLTRARRHEDLFSFEPVKIVPTSRLERTIVRVRKRFRLREWEICGAAKGSMQREIRALAPDLIHAHFGPSGLAILPYAKRIDVPLVTTFHGFDASSYLRYRSYLLDLKKLFSYSDIVTVSDEIKKNLLKLGADVNKIHRHYIGVPMNRFSMKTRRSIADKVLLGERIRFLQVSNFVEKKGHEYTIEAFSHLLRDFPACELVFVGEGPTQARCRDLVKELSMEQQVQFLGHQDTQFVSNIMHESDCFLHHSVTSKSGDKEGIPTVIMEAMATGMPVISTRHSGIPELIRHKTDGILVDEMDIQSYVEALNSIMSDDGRIGINSHDRVNDMFNIDKCSLGLMDLFENIKNSHNERTII